MTKRQRKTRKPDRPKKVTVKLFLNKNLQTEATGEKGKVYYPLYMLITYNRKNTMIRSKYGMHYRDLKEVEPGLLDFEEKLMRKTIAYELKNNPGTFELKGLHRKYEKYAVSIHLLFERYLKDQLQHIAIRTKPHEFAFALKFDDPNVTLDTLLGIAQRIYPDFSLSETLLEEVEIYNDYRKLYNAVPIILQYPFPTVIEWLDKSAEMEYRNKLEVVYKNDTDMINACIALIDKVVKVSIEGL